MNRIENKEKLLVWLLEEENPEVKLRVLREYLKYEDNNPEVIYTKEILQHTDIYQKAVNDLFNENKWRRYDALIALAEWGLTRDDVEELDKVVFQLIEETGFKMMCGEGLLLRNLVKLGFYKETIVKDEIDKMFAIIKEDGGFGCFSKNKKINDPKKKHKSCARITANYLMLLAELKLQGITMECEENLIYYFSKRNVLFRTDDLKKVMVPVMRETFYPIDAIQIGVQNLIYALSILGQGRKIFMDEAWEILMDQQGQDGTFVITKSKTLPAFKPGRMNKSSKWITLYVLMADSL